MSENNTDYNVDAIVNANTALVYSIAGKYRSQANCADFDDLVSAGLCGLLSAAQKVDNGSYDPEKSAMSTFLGQWITAAVLREVKHLNNTVRVPEYAQQKGESVTCGPIPEEFDPEDTRGIEDLSGVSAELLTLLATIEVEDAKIFVRSVVRGESLRAIGSSLGVSGEAVRKRIARIREELLSNA